jgi:hypothetical protein
LIATRATNNRYAKTLRLFDKKWDISAARSKSGNVKPFTLGINKGERLDANRASRAQDHDGT